MSCTIEISDETAALLDRVVEATKKVRVAGCAPVTVDQTIARLCEAELDTLAEECPACAGHGREVKGRTRAGGCLLGNTCKTCHGTGRIVP